MLMTTERVWEEFNIQLKQFILKRVQEEQSAQDILQNVFLKIHMHIDTLRDEDKMPGWIYQITRNAISDYYRQHKTTLALPEAFDMPAEPADENVVAELAPCIKLMVDSLPADYREALILTEYKGLTQKELGQRLGISLPGAKSRVQRAREKLKTLLLNCCHFQFDSLGKVIDYQPRCNCCASHEYCHGCQSA
ncbi:MAG: RNA polymerase sigma factor SigZ [Ktedonobacteraceae bacterium]